MNKVYIAIDLKSFYASVECMERGLNPLDTNLVVADNSRTEKTICLAVSPSLKSIGLPGRPRLFEVVQRVKSYNAFRAMKMRKKLNGKSCIMSELKLNPYLKLDYIVAQPQMALYTEYSTRIYEIYLKYFSSDDIHVYSIDEVFIDVTDYLKTYEMTAHKLAMTVIGDVLRQTGITATVGIGTNMYLCKIAMDVYAKKMKPDKNGARIAYLDEMTYRKELWGHMPITDFWRVGKGYAKKLRDGGVFTMGDIARLSLTKQGEDKLYKMFGINAELLIDHAWGWEPCTIADIKSYRPQNSSISSGQVLQRPYDYELTKLIIKEMSELLSLDLVQRGVVTNQIVLTVGYDVENIKNEDIKKDYKGEITTDNYGRKIPKHAHGTFNLGRYTASSRLISQSAVKLFERIGNTKLLSRRINITANNVKYENDVAETPVYEQTDLFTDYVAKAKSDKLLEKEKRVEKVIVELKNKYGKNAILRGMNLQQGATTVERNGQIGGHKA